MIFAVFLHKSHTWERSGSWDMGQNALDLSDYSIFKLTISLEQNNKMMKNPDFWHIDADS